jgi:tight adherence protein B
VKRAGALATGVASSALLLVVLSGVAAARAVQVASTPASASRIVAAAAVGGSAAPTPTAAQPTTTQVDAAQPANPGPGANRALEILGLLAIFVGVAGFLAAVALNSSVIDARDSRVRRRLSFYTLSGRGSRNEPLPTALGDSSVARSAVQLAGRLVGSRDLDVRLGRRLDGAGVPLKPAEWIVVQVASAAVFAVLFGLLGGGSAVAAVLGLLIGIGVPVGYLVIKEGRRTIAFLEQLPDTLQLIAGSLTVGHSLAQAMDAVVREERQPVSIEFNRALVETRLGMPVEDALEGISTRMDSQDFAWIVMAIRIQREVGGNLAEILTTVAATIRERERLRRQVRGLSAEGRLSAWILGGLPPIFATYLILVRPTYIKPLFTDPIGIALLAVMIVLMITGVLWLSRLVKVEV